MPQNLEFAQKWDAVGAKLFEEKRVIPHPVEVRRGLENIGEGLKDLEEGRVSVSLKSSRSIVKCSHPYAIPRG